MNWRYRIRRPSSVVLVHFTLDPFHALHRFGVVAGQSVAAIQRFGEIQRVAPMRLQGIDYPLRQDDTDFAAGVYQRQLNDGWHSAI